MLVVNNINDRITGRYLCRHAETGIELLLIERTEFDEVYDEFKQTRTIHPLLKKIESESGQACIAKTHNDELVGVTLITAAGPVQLEIVSRQSITPLTSLG